MAAESNPRMRARALWAWGKLPGKGNDAFAAAAKDADADVRCMAIRLARQLNLSGRRVCCEIRA
ncbi:MAG: hypothetical protein U0892_22255 [Pirellulales bacterium]